MRIILITLIIILLITPAISQPTPVGGSYGEAWLTKNGNKNVVPQATSLWDWGTIPKGQLLSHGTLTPMGDIQLIYPAFPTTETPIMINLTTPTAAISNLSTVNLSTPYLSDDPWFVAQTTGQPVVARTVPY